MTIGYVLRRFGSFLLIVWLATSLNFFLPRLSSTNPIRERLLEQALQGGFVQQGMNEMVAEYEAKFGLDKPIWQQYLIYMGDVARLDFNYSISNYPRTVSSMMLEALPWTIVLLTVTTLLAFVIGTLLGAFLGWPRAPRWLHYLMPPLMALHAIPFFALGLVLIYIFTFQVTVLPLFGAYSPGAQVELTWEFVKDAAGHAVLPALSIILGAIGGWMLGMRAMMITTQGEDYVTFADAKGLKPRTLFLRYAIRNALLPQVTGLALVLGHVTSGAVLVEYIFGYPGIGNVLFNAIRQSDYYVMQGIVISIIVTLGIATFILDLIYPLLDPRISYRGA